MICKLMTKEKRRVCFQDDVTVRKIPCRSSWSTDDLSTMYYSIDDLKEFRSRERRISKKLSSSGQMGSLDFDGRGRCTIEAKSLRQKRALDSIKIVLQEQSLQCFYGGKVNPDGIAKVYSGATIESKLFARHRAFDVALHVLEDIDEETISWSCCSKNAGLSVKEKKNPGLETMYISTPKRPRLPTPRSRAIVIPLERLWVFGSTIHCCE